MSRIIDNRGMSSELVSNRRAYHDYEILETYEAGVMLMGTEVKSLRDHGGSLQEAYVRIIGNELFLVGASIAPYKFGVAFGHEEKRSRKLLMHKREIARLKGWVKEKGQTLVPLALYLKQGRIKLRLGRAKGKKKFDKRQVLKAKTEKRRIDRAIKEHN